MTFTLSLASNQNQEITFQRVSAFYDKHQSPFVKRRNPLAIKSALESSKISTVTSNSGEIVAIAAQFVHGNSGFSETGGVSVPNLNGFNLQAVMMACLAIGEHIFEPPSKGIIAITSKTNPGSQANIKKSGFLLIQPPAGIGEVLGYGTDFPSDRLIYQFNNEAARSARDWLIKISQDGFIEKNGKKLYLATNLPILEAKNRETIMHL